MTKILTTLWPGLFTTRSPQNKTMSNKRFLSFIRPLGRGLLFFFLFLGLLVLTQDIQLFPAVLGSLFYVEEVNLSSVHRDLESTFVSTVDGERIELWRLPAEKRLESDARIALFFHGNGGPLKVFFPIQQWLSRIGFTNYSFDYRGYGRSSGWPSEQGIYRDAEAVWDYIVEREAVGAKEVVVMGLSIGSGAAAYIASKNKARALILLSAYTNIYDAARDRPVIGWFVPFLSPFLRYDFPTKSYVAELEETCLVVVHGKQDQIMEFRNAEELAAAYRGTGKVQTLFDEHAGHNDLFFRTQRILEEKIQLCLAAKSRLDERH